ncbi:MAG TPA: hypothetical protein VG649_02435 [Candidatus Angelobacter sp.]|jgi:hypothetical protein|nr:hypothetical protein [Candidatus Angelobacter sp.]
MTTVKAAMIVFFLCAGLAAQAPASQPDASQPASPELNAIIADVQKVALSSNGDLGKLRIEKWKTDGAQKQQMQQVTESLQRNINNAIPGLISDLKADPNSVSKAFKLYHNMNVVYEFMSSLAEATGAFGKKEEYEPLANDASALDKVRQDLSGYVEKTATTLDAQIKRASTPASPQTTASQQPKKIIVDDDTPSKKTKKTVKKKPASNSQP